MVKTAIYNDGEAVLVTHEWPDDCGDDLEYTPEFVSLLQASIGKSEQQFGAAIIPAEPPDWNRIEQTATGLLRRSVDVRILALLTRAWTENEGLVGYARGISQLAEALTLHWDSVHPRLYVAEEFDPMQRVNAIAAFADPQNLVRSLRGARLVIGPQVQLSLRETLAILEAGETAERTNYPGGSSRLRSELSLAQGQTATFLVAIESILETVDQLKALLAERLEPSWQPSFASIEDPLRVIAAAASQAEYRKSDRADRYRTAPPTLAEAESVSGGASNACSPSFQSTHQILARSDAMHALWQACEYLEKAEPSHPAPLLIRRALRLLQMNFYEIVRELIPEGLQHLEAISGKNGSDDHAA